MPGVVNVVPGSMVSGNVGEGHRAVLPGLIGTGDERMFPGPVSGGLGMVVPCAGGNGGAGRIVPGMVTGGIGSMVAGSVGGSGNIPNANLLVRAMSRIIEIVVMYRTLSGKKCVIMKKGSLLFIFAQTEIFFAKTNLGQGI